MANTLIGCGGTGAHVALAFMRLHALGAPLGFFRRGSSSMELPALYLVDQDDGDGSDPDKSTAWQRLRRVVEEHPFRGNPSLRLPKPAEVSPLPVGENKDFIAGGMASLERRYPNSDYLACILSPEQRAIEFSRGMMGSPAVGSLLFKLKSYDTKDEDSTINHDRIYHQMLRVKGRVAVVGSGVGGTGAAVGPTLAEELSESPDRQVMAVMLLNWFEFNERQGHVDDRLFKAQRRNLVMRENAHSGLRYYGRRLAEHAATVPIGIPRKALELRDYTGDNHQEALEAYPHAAAAICCLRQFLDEEAYPSGLYHLDAQDPSRLGLGTGLPGTGGGTVRDLANAAKTLADTLTIFGQVLGSREPRFLRPVLCEKLGDQSARTGKELDKLRDSYQENYTWLRERILAEDPEKVDGSFANEAAIRERLKEDPLKSNRLGTPKEAALEVFDWAARWVRDKASLSEPSSPNGVYWPEMREDEGLTPSPKRPGELQQIRKSNVQATLDSFVDSDLIAQNGWPHPLAAVRHFEQAINYSQHQSVRQLELLCLGFAMDELELRKTSRRDPRDVSIDQLIDEAQEEDGAHLVGQVLKRPGRNGLVMGFTAPDTLFCPVPGLPESEWSQLWKTLTGRHGSNWKAERPSWGSATSSVRRIRAWIEACKRRHPDGTPPAWTRIFAGESAEGGYGGGPKVEVQWDKERVGVFLPSLSDRGPSRSAEKLEEADRREFEFLRKDAEASDDTRSFRQFSFEIAGEGKVNGIWDDHLRLLHKQGKIEFFSDNPDRKEVYVTVSVGREYRRVTLPDTLLLRRGDMGIRDCTPMEQAHVPNSDTSCEVLYPHYPVRWRYFDLIMPVDAEGEESILDVLKQGKPVPKSQQPQPKVHRNDQQASWSLPMRGRTDQVNFVAKTRPPHKAHWMVWPRFHAPNWRAYYAYQHCTDAEIQIDTLWLNDQGSGPVLARTEVREDRRSYPIQFSERESRHAGGPPVAFCASRGSDEFGLYLVQLDPIQSAAASMQIGIDFGTSHTTAALKLGGQETQSVDLAPELSKDCTDGLSFHVSENALHVEDKEGPLSRGTWFPRYVKSSGEGLAGLWPSEILTTQPIGLLKNEKPEISDWHPARDYVIPPVGLLRERLSDYRIGNFKWNTSTEFYGKEAQLRKIYLDRIVEQVLAEAFVRHGRPDQQIQFTFTYPLRTPPNDVEEYKDTLATVLQNGSASLGCTLELHNGIGMYDESHAVKSGTNRFGDVNLVGDLGGGTLDLIISAPRGDFKDAADSVMLGGTKLLELLANQKGLFPNAAEWGKDSAARLANLTAWVRTKGITGLFGLEAERKTGSEKLGVKGFGGDAAEPDKARTVIRRYFFLVCEFMARSLCAYLATHWMPKISKEQQERLRIRVYLRGNGWKLWHEKKEYDQIERRVQERVMERVHHLWPATEPPVTPPNQTGWRDDHHRPEPELAKRAVVKNVVAESEDPGKVRNNWFSHTLCELGMDDDDRSSHVVDWHQCIPFKTKGKETTRIEFSKVQPAIPLSSSTQTKPESVTTLPADATGKINENLEKGEYVGDDQLYYQAPVAALIWEAVLDRKIGKARK